MLAFKAAMLALEAAMLVLEAAMLVLEAAMLVLEAAMLALEARCSCWKLPELASTRPGKSSDAALRRSVSVQIFFANHLTTSGCESVRVPRRSCRACRDARLGSTLHAIAHRLAREELRALRPSFVRQ